MIGNRNIIMNQMKVYGTIKKSVKINPIETLARVQVELFCENEEKKQAQKK